MRLSQPTRILLALIVGLSLGIVAMTSGATWVEGAASIAEPIGGLWLNALQMTIVPLVVSLIMKPVGSFVQVSAGAAHTCGLHFDGTITCWGAGTTNTGLSPHHGQSAPPRPL